MTHFSPVIPLSGTAYLCPGRARAWVVLSVLCVALGAPAHSREEGPGAGMSRFERTVAYLQDAPAAQQTDFAIVALAELVAVYMAEADLARASSAQPQGSPRAALLGWSIAVDEYANRLLLVLDELEQGQPVTLRPGQPGPAVVTVAGHAVILGHPRADQQGAFEQRVLTDFCSRHDCVTATAATATAATTTTAATTATTATTTQAEPIPVTIVRVNPLWTFTASGPVCSIDGIEVAFNSSSNLASLRGICEQFVQELAALANELAGQRRHGVALEWDGFMLSATPGRPEHLVRLNGAGDSVLVTVPLLFGSPNLLADVKPWLAARVGGEAAPTVRLDAANYGWLEQ